MADSKQFYMKFNVKDFRTDTNLCECSPASIGVYIMFLCVLFDNDKRGRHKLSPECISNFADILPRQNIQQNNQQTSQQLFLFSQCVAGYLAKHLPFREKEVIPAIHELLLNNVLYLEGDYLCQKRMVNDAKLSEIRSNNGKKGAATTNKSKDSTSNKKKAKPHIEEVLPEVLLQQNTQQTEQQKQQQNPNYNSNSNYNSILLEDKGVSNNMSGGVGEKKSGGKGDEHFDDFFEGKWDYEMPLNICRHFYFSHAAFSLPKEGAIKILMNYYHGAEGGEKDLAVQKERIVNRLLEWSDKFNEYVIRIGAKTDTGDTVLTLTGKDGWANFFHNWLNSQKDKLSLDPKKLIENQTVKGSSTGAKIISGNISVENQEEFYARKA